MAEYYVAATGGANGTGGHDGTTEAKAWATIEYAIAQTSAGDTINLLPGTHAAKSGGQDINTSLIFVGADPDTTFITPHATTGTYIFQITGASVSLSFADITFNATRDLSWYILGATDNTGATHEFIRCRFMVEDDVTLSGGSGPIRFQRQQYGSKFEDCTFGWQNGTSSTGGIYLTDGAPAAAEATMSLSITGCTFAGFSASGSGQCYLNNQPNIIVEGCTFTETGSTGTAATIYIGSSPGSTTAPDCGGFIIRNNKFTTAKIAGLVIKVGDDVASAAASEGKLANGILEGNTILGPWYTNPALALTGGALHGLLYAWSGREHIRNNVIDGCYYGIIAKGGATDWLYQGGIYGNLIINCPKSGIYCKGVAKIRIWNNTLYHGSTGTDPEHGNLLMGVNDTGVNSYVIFSHNIAYGPAARKMINLLAGGGTTGHSYDNNCYYCPDGEPVFQVEATAYASFDAWQAGLGSGDQGSFVADPQFASITNMCFKLLSTSLCAKGALRGSEEITPAGMVGIIYRR